MMQEASAYCPGRCAGGPWAAVEAMADNTHSFNDKEKIIAKIRFHHKKK
jgi:hypothetical protein